MNDSHQPGGCGRCFCFYCLTFRHAVFLYMPSPARASELYSLRKHFSITYMYRTCFIKSHEYSCQVGARCPLYTSYWHTRHLCRQVRQTRQINVFGSSAVLFFYEIYLNSRIHCSLFLSPRSVVRAPVHTALNVTSVVV